MRVSPTTARARLPRGLQQMTIGCAWSSPALFRVRQWIVSGGQHGGAARWAGPPPTTTTTTADVAEQRDRSILNVTARATWDGETLQLAGRLEARNRRGPPSSVESTRSQG